MSQGSDLTTWQLDTFEHRHENKSCSACSKDQTLQPDNMTTWQHDTFEHRHENKRYSSCLKDQTWQLYWFPAHVWLSDDDNLKEAKDTEDVEIGKIFIRQ